MKKKSIILFLLFLALSACTTSSTENKNADPSATNDNELPTEKEEEEEEPNVPQKEELESFNKLIANNWYKGAINDLPIWFYISYLEGSSCSAFYGYESSKGAAIEMNGGKIAGSKVNLSFEDYSTKYKENFNLNHSANSGKLEGQWTNNKGKKMAISLEPVAKIPKTAKDLLELYANTGKTLKIEDYSSNFFVKKAFLKSYYADKKLAQFIPNLGDFIPKIYEIGKKEAIKTADKGGVLIAKITLLDEQSLLIFSTNFPQDYKNEYNETYLMSNQGMLCAALLDKDGNSVKAVILGNDPDAEGSYYLDISIEVTAEGKIKLTWDEFANMGGRILENRTVQTIIVKNKDFKIESSKKEAISN